MIVRNLRSSDIPILQQYAEHSGFPYPKDLSEDSIKAIVVVADDFDHPIAACAAKELIELYGYFQPELSTSLRLEVLKCLHRGMAEILRANGYNGAEAFLPPQIAQRFGRRLERTFGWIKNWQSWTIRF